MVHSHRPADEGCFGLAVQSRRIDDCCFSQTSHLCDMLWSEAGYMLGKFFIAGSMCSDICAIDQALTNQDMSDAINERDIAAGLDWQMNVSHHGCLGHPRIDDDQGTILVALQSLTKNRMIVSDVGANQQDHIGGFHVLIRAWGTITAEGKLIT